ncbi:MAG: hypothetical protein K6E59_05350, partial [Bacilli bacterium]|nr:hypothetical protein [Bacilli bacterium]
NAMDPCTSVFSVILLLDQEPASLGIHDYATFHACAPFDPQLSFLANQKDGDWDYLTSVCINLALPEASPKGTCVYSITALPRQEAFDHASAEEYEEYKNRHAKALIEAESKRLGVNLRDHILDMTIETPLTIFHFASAYGGNIYGYRHTMDNHVTARTMLEKSETFIKGLVFCGAHQSGGDGMAPAIMNGRAAANQVLAQRKEKR